MKIGQKPKSQSVYEIPVELIFPNPDQPRKNFKEDELVRLADSIKRYGLLQPISVRCIPVGKKECRYEIVAGERRMRACKILGWSTVPCIVCEADSKSSFELAVVENTVRCDLDMFEQAEAMLRMQNEGGLTQEQVAERLSVSQGCVANKLRLLRFAPHERKLITFGELTERHARALLRLEDINERLFVMQAVIENKLSVAQTDEYISAVIAEKTPKLPEKELPEKDKNARVTVRMKDTRIFINTLERSVSLLKASGINVNYEKTQALCGDMTFSIKISAC